MAKNVLKNENCMRKTQTYPPPPDSGAGNSAPPYFGETTFLAASRLNLSRSLAGITEMGKTMHLFFS